MEDYFLDNRKAFVKRGGKCPGLLLRQGGSQGGHTLSPPRLTHSSPRLECGASLRSPPLRHLAGIPESTPEGYPTSSLCPAPPTPGHTRAPPHSCPEPPHHCAPSPQNPCADCPRSPLPRTAPRPPSPELPFARPTPRALRAPLAQRPGAIAGWRAGRAQLTWAGCRELQASPDAERSRQAWVGLLCRHILTARARPAPPRLPLTLPTPIPSQGDSPSLARPLVGPVSP